MRLRDWLIPNDKIFFDLLVEEVSKVDKATDVFYKAIINKRFNKQTVGKIKKLEHECDQIVHKIFAQLNQTFITPIDHEDIGRLAISCDDLIDLIFVISQRIDVYKINGANKTLVEFTKIVKKMMDETSALLSKSTKLKQKLLLAHAKKIHRLENEADDLAISSLRKVLKKKDVKQIIIEKEVYELMEVLTDRIEDFCDIVQGIVTKNL